MREHGLEGIKLFPDRGFFEICRWKLEDVYREEKMYWKHKIKENWLKHGKNI